jgi:hypothetical protein
MPCISTGTTAGHRQGQEGGRHRAGRERGAGKQGKEADGNGRAGWGNTSGCARCRAADGAGGRRRCAGGQRLAMLHTCLLQVGAHGQPRLSLRSSRRPWLRGCCCCCCCGGGCAGLAGRVCGRRGGGRLRRCTVGGRRGLLGCCCWRRLRGLLCGLLARSSRGLVLNLRHWGLSTSVGAGRCALAAIGGLDAGAGRGGRDRGICRASQG